MRPTHTSISALRILVCISLVAINVLLMGCGKPEEPASIPDNDEVQSSSYDANSWKTLIPPNCLQYFDGCNNCRRDLGSQVAACTRKACFEYKEPKCLDKAPQAMTAPEAKQIVYLCDSNNQFTVFYGEYQVGDQHIKLPADEVHFRDHQTKTVFSLKRIASASGEKYSDQSLEFWAKDDSAMVSKGK